MSVRARIIIVSSVATNLDNVRAHVLFRPTVSSFCHINCVMPDVGSGLMIEKICCKFKLQSFFQNRCINPYRSKRQSKRMKREQNRKDHSRNNQVQHVLKRNAKRERQRPRVQTWLKKNSSR